MKIRYILILMLTVLTGVAFSQTTSDLPTQVETPLFGDYLSPESDDNASAHFTLGSSVFENSPRTNASEALYGHIPGLLISGTSITLYGKSPLIIIDGFARAMSNVTSAQIASISVLNDAASTAIYGLEGANGVVIITTRKGDSNGLKISGTYQLGLHTAFRAPEFADSYTYANKLNEALVLDGLSPRYNHLELDAFKNGTNPYEYPNVDWYSEIYKDVALSHNMNFSFTGGNEKFRYFSAVDYVYDESMLKGESIDDRYSITPSDTRLNLRGNIDVDLTSTTRLSLGVMAKLQEVNASAGASSAATAVYTTPSAVFPVTNHLGTYGSADGYGANNPYALLYSTGNNQTTTSTLMSNLKIEQDLDIILKGLSIDASVGFDNIGAMSDNTSKSYSYSQYNPTILEDGTVETNMVTYGEDSQTLTYDEDGFESLYMRSELIGKINYKFNKNRHAVAAALQYSMQAIVQDGEDYSTKRQTYAASASYNYDSRYFVDGAVSRAGSGFLPADSRFITYPAVSVGWVASNESFLSGSKVFDYLKIFGSFGLSGTDAALSYDMYNQYYGDDNASQYFFSTGYTANWGQAEGDYPSIGLTAELSKKATVGIQSSHFNNRLSFYASVFSDYRSNILMTNQTVSGVLGLGVAQQNIGETHYKGGSLSLVWSDKKGDFSYKIHANGSFYTSEIIENGEAWQQYDYLSTIGNAENQCYGLEVIGIFQNQMQINNSPVQMFSDTVSPGDLQYKDQNGDGVINDEDVVKMFGSSVPNINIGFGFDIRYKRFELLADFQGVAGVTKSLLSTGLYNPLVLDGNISNTFLEREVTWTAETAETATMPRLTTLTNDNNYRSNSLWYRDASFIKLRNLKVAYTAPISIRNISNVTLYLQGTDLFSIDKLGFVDPESFSYTPSIRSFWLGVNVQF